MINDYYTKGETFMIKLIASDMDGTLLDENGKIPAGFFEQLEKLKKNNITFVVASGRPYFTLRENFKPYQDDIEYICDNGAYVVAHGDTFVDEIDKNMVRKILKQCESIEDIHVILCGVKSAYLKPCKRKEFSDEIFKYYINTTEVSDLNDIDDIIFKVTICDLRPPAENSHKHLNPLFGNDFKLAISGKMWMDINNKNTNKGQALRKIQEKLGVSFNETMVFGDFYNDVEMLKEGHYSFVMANACEDMKKHGRFIADSNVNHGVLKAIEENCVLI